LTDIAEYDGFYFQPVANDDVEISYFKFNEDKDRGDKIEGSSLGDLYHIVIWKYSDSSVPFIDDRYEAILIDPITYVNNLLNSTEPMYGVILRKTTESFRFIDSYIVRFEESVDKAVKALTKLKK
jgi:hypothetical protein